MAFALPEYPALQTTATVWVVVPVMEPAVALFEFATCAGVQVLAEQLKTVKVPALVQVTVPEPL